MPLSSRTLLLSILSASAATAHAGWAHGWRDQYIRVSQRLGQRVSAEMRHMRKLGLLGENEGAPEHLKQKARDAIRHAERVHHAQRHNARELAKPEHERRQLMEVECSGKDRTCTVNGMTHADMSLFDCPWINSLHPYLNTTITAASLAATATIPGVEPAVEAMTESPHPYLRANPNPFVDGGLCLPFQEIPFPFPTKLYGGVDTAAANIQCPGPGWDPDKGECSSGPGTCEYAGDKKLHGGAMGVAENYGCAAGFFGWPSTSADSGELQTPICKTYVDDCTYSKKPTRKYKYEKAAAEDPLSLGGGYDYNWVLWSISKIRTDLGLNADMEAGRTLTL